MRSIPLRISLPATDCAQAVGSRGCSSGCSFGVRCRRSCGDDDLAVDDRLASNTATGWVAGSVLGSPVCRLNALPCFGHSSSSSSHHTSPSDSDTLAWLQMSPIAYTSLADADDGDGYAVDVELACRCRRRRSSKEQTSVMPTCLLRAGGSRGRACSTTRPSQIVGDVTGGKLRDHLIEEAEHDESFGDLGADTAALEIEALVLVDRADGGGMAALDVVRLDVEVRARSRPTLPRTA